MSRHVCKSRQETTGSALFLIRSVFIRSARLVVWWNRSHTHACAEHYPSLYDYGRDSLVLLGDISVMHRHARKHTYALRHAHTPLFVLCSVLPSLTLRYGCRVYISSVSIIWESLQDSGQLWKKRLYLNYLHLDSLEFVMLILNEFRILRRERLRHSLKRKIRVCLK